MKNFFSLYGFRFILACLGIFFLPGSLYFLYREWKSYGVAADMGKIEWEQSIFYEDPPLLDTHSIRVKQGDIVRFCELATAVDAGEDITEQIVFRNEEGTELRGKANTEITGEIPVIVSVKSLRSGVTVKKKIIILVDGRVL